MRLLSANTLALRFTGPLVGILVLSLGAMAAVQIYLQQRHARKSARLNGINLSEALYGSLHNAMLANDRQGLHADLRSIAHRTPELRIRIFNKEGVIMFSSNTSEQGEQVDRQSEACYRCHTAHQTIERLPPGERVRTFKVDGTSALGVIKPIENESVCYKARCHAHPPDKRLLGVLDVTLVMSSFERNTRLTALLMTAAAGAGLLLTVLVTMLLVRRAVHGPVKRLLGTLDRLRQGDYTTRHPRGEQIHEFLRLGDAINATAHDLQRANAEVVGWAQTLERRVEAKTEELHLAQEKILQVERMASLGKLAAVVAHEINNPLASVVTYSKLLLKRAHRAGDQSPELKQNLEILEGIASESARCGEIVSNLLLFARRQGTHMEPADLGAVVDRVLFVLKHKLDLAGVRAVTELSPELQPLLCDPAQLEQTLLALCVNAIEAMPGGGTLRIGAEHLPPTGARLRVIDTGGGIPEEVRPYIFEPFFSSKPEAEGGSRGVGLGLAVVYGIVQRHGGSISVDSAQGQGATFTLDFPGRPLEDDRQEE